MEGCQSKNISYRFSGILLKPTWGSDKIPQLGFLFTYKIQVITTFLCF